MKSYPKVMRVNNWIIIRSTIIASGPVLLQGFLVKLTCQVLSFPVPSDSTPWGHIDNNDCRNSLTRCKLTFCIRRWLPPSNDTNKWSGISLAALELVLVLVIGFKVRLGSEFVRVLCSWSTGSDTDRPGLFIADFKWGLCPVESWLGLGMGVFPGPLGSLCWTELRSCLGRDIWFCATFWDEATLGQSA